ncbi:VOC family protein [Devosia sp. ZB163]|uniref:VOC family protein n=1 Tax=Devosia sp. ZB163 TaxID=3025938 RepID=UPI00235FBCA8|nr:VOC family protein [Devosia sp. ZB163]MDC9826552.1 VOC family protein [Devosia sp. ZB163]
MSSTFTRRTLLRLAGAATLSAAAAAAARAEGIAPGTTRMFAVTTPVHVRDVTLRVRDLANMTGYYRLVLGLEVLSQSDEVVELGADGKLLLTLEKHADAALEPRTAAGLYHTAFLMPSREDLARWLVHAAAVQAPITGFADHLVSEAIYLDDPEGNGIEVYSDRPESGWLWVAGRVAMGSEPLDIDGILALANTERDEYMAAPAGLCVGHIHLRAGNIDAATAFYGAALGLDVTSARADAVFLSSGRYHHHVALNTWESRGAGQRDATTTGLARFSLTLADADLLASRREQLGAAGHAAREIDGGIAIIDPWGTEVRLVV